VQCKKYLLRRARFDFDITRAVLPNVARWTHRVLLLASTKKFSVTGLMHDCPFSTRRLMPNNFTTE
jgi:hypothetical protein